MSKSYLHSWDDSRSPLDRRPASNTLSPSSATGPSTSYKANVNRQKTKRWEAKPVSYDGDDWGDGDDYDEYDEESHEPSTVAQPTGLRQPGQSLDSTPRGKSVENLGSVASGVGQGRRQYGSLPSLDPVRQQPGRSVTSPVPPAINTDIGRPRANSFDEGDEGRAFPQNQVPPMVTQSGERPHAPPTRFSQMGFGSPGAVGASPGVVSPLDQRRPPSDVAQQGPPRPSSRTSSISVGSARGREYPSQPASSAGPPRGDYPSRDFSPPAMPNPVHSRGVSTSPVNHVATPDTSHGGRFPPRKSSLSQLGPYSPTARASSAPPPGDGPPVGSQSRSSSVSVGSGVRQASQERPGSATDKPRPFIRPADIYKRVEEEREKERKSLDSARPILDIATNHRAADHEATIAAAPAAGLKERLSSESLGRGVRARQSLESIDGTESGKRLRPSLDPVRERKSEYGFEALPANAPDYSGDPEAPRVAGGPPSEALRSDCGLSTSTSNLTATSTEELGSSPRASIGLRLPDLSRFSGFGDAWLSGPSGSGYTPASSDIGPAPGQPETVPGKPGVESDVPLSHQPSVGFRSVVHQAFDRIDDKSVPPTPALSAAGSQRSNGGDSVRRTDSASTSGISPIMSRVPSSAMTTGRARGSEGRESGTPAIAEEESLDSRRNSKTSISLGNQDQAVIRKRSPSPMPHNTSTDSLPLSFKMGHRRDLSTPSTSNSPKRSPVLGYNDQLPSGEKVELATQPIGLGLDQRIPPTPERTLDNEGTNVNYTTGGVDIAAPVNPSPGGEAAFVAATTSGVPESPASTKRDSLSGLPSVPPKGSDSRSGSRSPSKGRVRGLAEKFENGNQHPGIDDRTRPISGSRWSGEKAEISRSVLPRSTVSSGMSTGVANPDDGQREAGHTIGNSDQPSSSSGQYSIEERDALGVGTVKHKDVDLVPTIEKRPLVQPPQGQQFKGPLSDVLGGAAGASVATTGLRGYESSNPANQTATTISDLDGSQRGELVDRTPASRSPAPEGPITDQLSDRPIGSSADPRSQLANAGSLSSRSSIPPPPPPKDTQLIGGSSEAGLSYVAPIAPLKHGNVDQMAARDAASTSEFFAQPSVPPLSIEATRNHQQGDRPSKEVAGASSGNRSPRPILGAPTAPLMSVEGLRADRRISVGSGVPEPRPESSYLPSVYDDYFTGGGDDNENDNPHVPTSQPEVLIGTNDQRNEEGGIPAPADIEQNEKAGVLAPASIQGDEQATGLDTVPVRPLLLRNRFSWEAYGDEVESTAAASTAHNGQTLQRDQSFSSVTTPDPELRQLIGTGSAYLDRTGSLPDSRQQKYTTYVPTGSPVDRPQGLSHGAPIQPSPVTGTGSTPESVSHRTGTLTPVERVAAPSGKITGKSDDRPTTSDLEVADINAGGERGARHALEGAAVAELPAQHQPGDHETATPEPVPGQTSRPSTTQSSTDKGHATTPEPTLNVGDRLSRSSVTGTPSTAEVPDFVSRRPSQETAALMPPQSVSAQAKFPTFREILALKSPTERIKTYNETREQFAAMNSGLAHWIAATSSQNLGLAGPIPQGSLPQISTGGRGSPPRSAFHKHSPSGPAPPLQEPYYKQYMQFSSATPSPTAYSGSAPRPSANVPPGAQGFSPSEGGEARQSSQPTQHKRMELFHAIGGKAGGAAKGLFAKGRNKLKGEKASNTTSSSPASSRSVQLPPESQRQQQGQRPVSLQFSQPSSPSNRGPSYAALPVHDVMGGSVSSQGYWPRQRTPPEPAANQPQERHLHLANPGQPGQSPQQQGQPSKSGFRLFSGAKKQDIPKQPVEYLTRGVVAPQPPPPLQPQPQSQEGSVSLDFQRPQQHIGDRTEPLPSRDASYLLDRSSSDVSTSAPPVHDYPAPRALPPHLTAYPASVDGSRSAATESPILGSDPIYHGKRPAHPEGTLAMPTEKRSGSPADDGDSKTQSRIDTSNEQSVVRQPHHPEALALPGAPATSRDVSPVPSYIREAQQDEAISRRSVSIVSRDVSPVRSVVGDVGDDYVSESPRSQQKLKISESLEKGEEDSGFVGLPPARRSSTFDIDVGGFKGEKEIEEDVGTLGSVGEGSEERVAEPVAFAIAGVGAGLTKTERQVRVTHDDDDVSSVQLESETEPEPAPDRPKLVTASQQSASSGSGLTPKGESSSFPDREVQRFPDTEAVLPQVPHRVSQDSSHQATPTVPVSQQSRTGNTFPLQPPLVPPPEQQRTPAGNSRGAPEPFTLPLPHHPVNERLSQRPPDGTLPPLQTVPVLPPEGQQEPPSDRRPHRTFTLPAPQSPIDQRLSLTTTPPQHVSPTRYGHEQGYRGPDLGLRGDPRGEYPPQFMAPGQHLPNAPLRGLSMSSSQVLRGPPGQGQKPNQPLGFSGPPLTQQQPGVPRYLVGRSGLPSDVPTQFYTRQLPPSESLYALQQGAEYQPRAAKPPGTHGVQQPPPPKTKRGLGFFKSLSMSSKPDKPPQTQASAGPSQPAPSLPTLTERNSRVSISTMGSGSELQEKKQKRSSFFGPLTMGPSSEDQRQQQQQEQQLHQQQRQQQYQQLQQKPQRQQQQYQEPPQQQPPPPRERASWYGLGPGHRAPQQNAGGSPPPTVLEPTRSGLAVAPSPTHGPPRLVHSESGPPRVSGGPVTAGSVPAPFPPRGSSQPSHPSSDFPHVAGPGGLSVLSAAPAPPQARGLPYLTRSASDIPHIGGPPAPSPGLGSSAPPPAGGPLRLIHQSSEPPHSGLAPAPGPGVTRFMASPPLSRSSPGPGYPGPTPLDPRSSHMQGPPGSSTGIKEAKLHHKLVRSGTAGPALETPGGKKRGFSGLSNLFSRSSTTGHKHSASTPTVSQPLLGSGQPALTRNSPHSLHPVAETRDGAPPLEGYYAPRSVQGPLLSRQAQSTQPPPSGSRSPEELSFIGGRRFSEQRVATAKHTFESEQGFRGSYRPSGSPPGSPSAAAYAPEPPTAVTAVTAERGSTPTAQPPTQSTRVEPSLSQPLHRVEPQYETQPIPAPYSPSVPTAAVPAPAFIPVLFPPGFDPAQLPQGMPGHYVYIPHPVGPSNGSPPPHSQVTVSQQPTGSRPPHVIPFTIAAPTPISPTAIPQQASPNTGSPVPALSPAVAQQQYTSSLSPANSPVSTQQQALPTLNINTSHATSATVEARSPPKEHPDQQTPWTLSIPGESVEEPPSRTITPIRRSTPHIEPSHPPAAQQDEDTVHSREPVHSPASTPLPDSTLASPLGQSPAPSEPITRTSSAITPPFPPLPPKVPHSAPLNPAPQTPTTNPPPPRTTLRRAPSSAAELEDTEPDAHMARRRAQEEKLLGFDSGGPRVGRESGIEEEGAAAADGNDEEVVMMSTAYPGQEWAPEGYGRWEFD
ncbi:MAG: hypothetical protein M1840_005724 [Geoglossum simile]|nr:MAG: hypothetical protein M1840_005724 [Geoglossum simile]